MFTGDSSGDTLCAALYRAGFANQSTAQHRADGLQLTDAYITAIARCVPPGNRPTAEEIANCRPYLAREWALMTHRRIVLALGQMAFDGCLRLLRAVGYDELPRLKFSHGFHFSFEPRSAPGCIHLVASYHPSRQNTQTGRLTPAMLDEMFELTRSLLANGD
jgi:uracil-DNA glycosylase family 4